MARTVDQLAADMFGAQTLRIIELQSKLEAAEEKLATANEELAKLRAPKAAAALPGDALPAPPRSGRA